MVGGDHEQGVLLAGHTGRRGDGVGERQPVGQGSVGVDVIDLTAHGGGTIRLKYTNASDLDAEDFQFYEPPADAGAGVDGL